MSKEKKIDILLLDKEELCYSLKITGIDDVLNFEIFKNNEQRLGEVGIGIEECLQLKKTIDTFIKNQKENKPKSKSGRKKMYEGESETLSIHVPSEKKEFIKSIVDAILEPMRIKN